MAQQEIPASWRKKVCAIIATEATGTLIRWTADAEKRYQAGSCFAWKYEIYQAINNHLSAPYVTGCLVTMADPPGETYEFLFQFNNKKFYGKILLRKDLKSIVIFSAHIADYTKLSCG